MTAYFTGPSVAWGPGAIEQLSGLGARRALLFVDRTLALTAPVRRVREELEKSETAVELVPAPPTPDSLVALVPVRQAWTGADPDWIVAVGGGRVIDGAKALRLSFEIPELPLRALPAVLPPAERPGPQLAAIPTTSGSGAEASWTADLWAEDGAPVELADRRLVPSWALVDPGFAASIPPAEVVPGALEVAGLAFESYLSAWSNPFSDALAVDAAATVVRRLPHAVKWSADPDAREAIHYAATAAGLAASNAQRGVAHALARALVAPTGLGYGQLVGMLLPPVLEFDRPGARERVEALAVAIASPDDRAPVPVAGRLRRLYETLRFPQDWTAAGVDAARVREQRETILAHALRSPAVLANPRVPNASDLGSILEALTRAPP